MRAGEAVNTSRDGSSRRAGACRAAQATPHVLTVGTREASDDTGELQEARRVKEL